MEFRVSRVLARRLLAAALISSASCAGGDLPVITAPQHEAIGRIEFTDATRRIGGATAGVVLALQVVTYDMNGLVETYYPVTWSSSDPSSVSVDQTGRATFIKSGAGVTITATATDGTTSVSTTLKLSVVTLV